jgi:hypothetical protein
MAQDLSEAETEKTAGESPAGKEPASSLEDERDSDEQNIAEREDEETKYPSAKKLVPLIVAVYVSVLLIALVGLFPPPGGSSGRAHADAGIGPVDNCHCDPHDYE